jgi:hypothetical protein
MEDTADRWNTTDRWKIQQTDRLERGVKDRQRGRDRPQYM